MMPSALVIHHLRLGANQGVMKKPGERSSWSKIKVFATALGGSFHMQIFGASFGFEGHFRLG